MLFRSKDVSYMRAAYPNPATTGLPQYYGLFGSQLSNVNELTYVIAPSPDQNYTVEVVGTVQPVALSNTNPTTFLTEYLEDLFLAASMVFASGYMRDFGSQSDNPQQAQSWEAQYQGLIKSAEMEEVRKKFAGPGWTSLSAVANPPNK